MKVLRHRLRLLTLLGLGLASPLGWLVFAPQNFSPAQSTRQQEPLQLKVQTGPDHGFPKADPETKDRVQATLERMPLYFIENQGQLDERVAYYVQGRDTSLYFTSKGLTFSFSRTKKSSQDDPSGQRLLRRSIAYGRVREQNRTERWVVKLDFIDANTGVRPRGEAKTPAAISYFQGPQQQWKVGLKSYSRLVYENLWPGIDLIYDGTANRLKYHFLVRPGADPNRIRLAYRGAKSISINHKNELVVTTPLGAFHDETPSAYQQIEDKRVEIPVSYLLEERDRKVDPYGFRLGSYDRTKALVLDPAILVYAGFIGGLGDDRATGIAVDGAGNAYITGETVSDAITFPVKVGPDLVSNGGIDAFVAKVSVDGSRLIYAGYIGGSGTDRGKAISLEPGCLTDCSAYIAGETTSNQTTFPVTVGPDLTPNGGVDAFVAKVSADGKSLEFAGYIGGSLDDRANAIAVDSLGKVYIAGETSSTQTSFPVTDGPDLTHNGGVDAFVAKISTDGKSLEFAGYIGGSLDDRANAIAVDSLGRIYVAGETASNGITFPESTGPDLTHNGAIDAFVAQVCNVCVDLALSGVSSPAATKPGQAITFEFTATNHGPDNATGVTFVDTLPTGVSFVSVTPGSGSCSGTVTVTCNLGTLANGASTTVSIVVTPTTTGSLTNNATVSADQPDTDLSSNTASVKTRVTLANLVAKITARPSNAAPGSTITISDETKNKESVSAEASITEFFLSTDKVLGGDTFLGSRSIPPLAPKQASTGSTTVTIPPGTAPGTYYILIVADSDQLVEETKEANVDNKSIKVTLPDLVVSVSGFSSAPAGSSITIKDSTKNRGAVPGDATTTKFFLSSDPLLDSLDVFLGSRSVDPLAAKQTRVGLTVVTIPPGTAAGSYFVIAVADADNTDSETDEGNNTTVKKLKVTP